MSRFLYLVLLLAELAYWIYDGTFNQSSIQRWTGVGVVVVGTFGFYCWFWRREAMLSRSLWKALLLIVIAWFFVYLPWYTFHELKDTAEIDLSLLLLPYVTFYILHVPMFFGLYSCAFRGRMATSTANGASGPSSHP